MTIWHMGIGSLVLILVVVLKSCNSEEGGLFACLEDSIVAGF